MSIFNHPGNTIMKYRNAFVIGVFSAVLLAGAAFAADDAQTTAREREIEDNLIAPCCWTQPVSQHYSEAADQIRKEVHEMVAAGKSRDEILDYYVAKYGERILATPRARGFNRLVYVLPWAALILGALILAAIFRRFRAQTPAAPQHAAAAADTSGPLAPDSRYLDIIEKEMKDLDE
jgi:cytochrome c-type biogenesis protein CcmH